MSFLLIHTLLKIKKNKMKKLKIIPLGGQEEVGRNMTVFEYGDDIVILDMGMQFPEENMPGIDYIVPNISYLKNKKKNIKAVIFSHGHLDHIGAAPILLEKLGYPPVIGRKFTLALVKDKLDDHKQGSSKNLKEIQVKDLDQEISLGAFKLGFFRVEHSIMDAMGVTLETEEGTVIHPGDWTVRKDKEGKETISYEHLSDVKRPSILMLESLGVTYTDARVPEEVMYSNLKKLITEAPGRTIIATFSSQIERISEIVKFAEEQNKKVALDGYSMRNNVKLARQFGYIERTKDTIINIRDISKYPDKKVIVLCTGAQGETRAVLNRIVQGNHKHISAKKSDTFVFSSSVIPGNERSIQTLKDELYRLSDHVIHSDIMEVHSGGHTTRNEIPKVIEQIDPDYLLPVYANHYMLKEVEKLAIDNGFKKDDVFVLDNGSQLEIGNNKPKLTHDVAETDYIFVDGSGVGDVGTVVLNDRERLSEDGIFVVITVFDKRTGKLQNSPDIISRGFVYLRASKELLNNTRKKVTKIAKRVDKNDLNNENEIKKKIGETVASYLYSKTERRPIVLPVVIKV